MDKNGHETEPGPLEQAKRGEVVAGHLQPDAAEVESARLLATDARPLLTGLPDAELQKLADRFIAEDRGTAVDDFVAWVREKRSA
ncbi:MAG: hypothetical protein ABR552_02760 [Actinomycetota bacterium]